MITPQLTALTKYSVLLDTTLTTTAQEKKILATQAAHSTDYYLQPAISVRQRKSRFSFPTPHYSFFFVVIVVVPSFFPSLLFLPIFTCLSYDGKQQQEESEQQSAL